MAQFFAPTSVGQTSPENTFSFTNPILEKGNDPWITQHDSLFYYCYSENKVIHVRANRYVHAIREGKEIATWTPPPLQKYSAELWAPELHFICGFWYIYFASDDGLNDNHRMYVLKSHDSNIGNGFEFVGQVLTRDNKWAIDGTVLQLNGSMYFIWSGWRGDKNVSQNLYIAKMDSPTSIASDRVLISQPDYEWEKRGALGGLPTINEGPQILQHNGEIFLIYSAAGSWSNFYCLGQLRLSGSDPLNALSWTKKSQPVFQGFGNVYSPGHASFLNIHGKDWIVYHTAVRKDAGWNRKVKLQPFSWQRGEPLFGKPLEDGDTVTIEY
ncbi:MAG: glycoside hydrolase family 43 protein [Chryseolinea sp.]